MDFTLFKILGFFLLQLITYAFPYIGRAVFWEAYEDPDFTSEKLVLTTPTEKNYETYREGFEVYLDFRYIKIRTEPVRDRMIRDCGKFGKGESRLLTQDNIEMKSLLFYEGPLKDYEEDALLKKSSMLIPIRSRNYLDDAYGDNADGDQVQIGFHFLNDLVSYDLQDEKREIPLKRDSHYTYKHFIKNNYPEDVLKATKDIRRETPFQFSNEENYFLTLLKTNEKIEEVRLIINKGMVGNFRKGIKKNIDSLKLLKITKLVYSLIWLKKKFLLPEKIFLIRKIFYQSFCNYYSIKEQEIFKKVVKVSKDRRKTFDKVIPNFRQKEGDFFDKEKKKLYSLKSKKGR